MTSLFNVPVIVAVSFDVDDVSVAVYVPSPLSATAPSVPAVAASTTMSPPAMRLSPPASLSWTVIVDVLSPSAAIAVGDAVIVDLVGSAMIAVNVTVALWVIKTPFKVPLTVAVAAAVDDVTVAV
jgi:hypothetical protein